MAWLHVQRLEEQYPDYRDKPYRFARLEFDWLNANPAFEMLCEIDKWRLLLLIALELQTQKPVLLDLAYLARKGFDPALQPICLTLQALAPFIEIVQKLDVSSQVTVGQELNLKPSAAPLRISEGKEERRNNKRSEAKSIGPCVRTSLARAADPSDREWVQFAAELQRAFSMNGDGAWTRSDTQTFRRIFERYFVRSNWADIRTKLLAAAARSHGTINPKAYFVSIESAERNGWTTGKR